MWFLNPKRFNSPTVARLVSILVILTVIAGVGSVLSGGIQFYALDQLFPEDHPQTLTYKNFLDEFGDDQKVHFLFYSRKNSIFDEDDQIYKAFREFHHSLYGIDGIHSFVSVLTKEHLTYKPQPPRIGLKNFYSQSGISAEAKRILKTDPFWKDLLVTTDGKALILSATLESALNPNQQNEVLRKVNAFVGTYNKGHPDFEVQALSKSLASYYFNLELMNQQLTVTPIALGVLLIGLWVLYRSFRVLLAYMLTLLLSVASMGIFLFYFEKGISPYTNFAILFIFVIATADFVHFVSIYSAKKSAHRESGLKNWLEATQSVLVYPCFLTTLTTALAFVSLSLSELVAIRSFGIYASLGTVFCFVYTLYFLPYFLSAFSVDLDPRRSRWTEAWIHWMGTKAFRFKKLLGGLLFLSLFAASYGLYQLRIDDHLYDKFVPDHPISRAFNGFSKSFKATGSLALSVDFKFADLGSVQSESQYLDLIQHIEALPNVSQVRSAFSYTDYIRRVTQRPRSQVANLAEDRFAFSVLELFKENGLLKNYFNKTYDQSLLDIRIIDLSASALKRTIASLEPILMSSGVSYELTGFSKVRAYVIEKITLGFVKSFGFTFGIIFLIFCFVFRSVQWAVLAMIPNLFPIFWIGGCLGLLQVDVDDSVILTTSILLGIAVDDSIHFLLHLKRNIGDGFNEAYQIAIAKGGDAIVGTTLIFTATSLCFFLTDIYLFHKMAMVLSAAMLLALICDLWVSPIGIRWLHRQRKGS